MKVSVFKFKDEYKHIIPETTNSKNILGVTCKNRSRRLQTDGVISECEWNLIREYSIEEWNDFLAEEYTDVYPELTEEDIVEDIMDSKDEEVEAFFQDGEDDE